MTSPQAGIPINSRAANHVNAVLEENLRVRTKLHILFQSRLEVDAREPPSPLSRDGKNIAEILSTQVAEQHALT